MSAAIPGGYATDAITWNDNLPPRTFMRSYLLAAFLFVIVGQLELSAQGTTSPMFGGTPYRNMVNLTDKNIPTQWDVDPAKLQNIKWVAEVGKKAYGGPVIANGMVFVGTNNDNPRDPKD